LSVLLFSAFLTGCLQTRQVEQDRQSQQAIEQRLRQQQEEEYRRRIQTQFDDLEDRQTESQQELQALRRELAQQPNSSDIRRLESRIDSLEQLLQRMDEQREKDRQEIIDSLSQRIATVMARQQSDRPESGGRVHEVARGETLSAIAAAYRVSSQAIIRANNLQNPDALRVGQRLTIPGN